MKMKVMVVSVLAAAAVGLCACSLPFGPGAGAGGAQSAGESDTREIAGEILSEEPIENRTPDDGKYHIGILTYQRHGASEETVSGFESELRSLLESEEVEFDLATADGDPEKCAKIATEFVNSGHQLIFACGTEALQNAGAAVRDVPIVGACVTDYLLSGVVSSLDAPGGNITGVSSMGPVEEQMDQIQRVSGWQETVGIISSGTEIGSRFQENVAGQCLSEDQIYWKSYHAATESGLRKAMEMAAEECSCIFLPTDNYVASHMDIVQEVMLQTGVPVVTGDYQMCAAGGLYCCSIDYRAHGKKAAEMAYGILEKGEEVSRMTVRKEEEWKEYYNPSNAEKMGWYNYGGMIPLEIAEPVSEDGTQETAEPEASEAVSEEQAD